MLKPIIAASFFALTASAPSLAQTAAPDANPPAKIELPESAPSQPAAHEKRVGAPSGTMATDKAPAPTAANQSTDWRASKLIGKAIVNAANESIGDINDLLVSADGKIDSVIVGVGGFLGIGEKNVALPFNSLKFTTDGKGNTVVMSKVTKASLESMPQWKATSKM